MPSVPMHWGISATCLDVSAKSPAMLYYLDSVKNLKADSNENYAREAAGIAHRWR